MEKIVKLCDDHYSRHLTALSVDPDSHDECDVLNCNKSAVVKVNIDIDEYGLARIRYDMGEGNASSRKTQTVG